ncbi:class I SAM-dependent methyltransferase [Sphingosinicella terrae]|uniref:class I SAM-dependent methyltransferase n=1 Tax=Sphingosinicella terrae TaxID=2172047 RepID=UPI0013B39EAA|nr:class I SAM-dependent methyltransferase [Sphingosinicella terrae]
MRAFLMLIEPLRLRRLGRPLKILDLGGTAAYWRALPGLYGADDVEITILNLDGETGRDANLLVRQGDARAVDFPDSSFDVVHSNSVIEHVGPWNDIARMGAEVRRLAPAFFIQTPNVWFPIEPHYKLPFVHWLPEQSRIGALKALGRLPRSLSAGEATMAVQRICLLSAAQLADLFPEARIWREKVAGFTKSLVAIRGEVGSAAEAGKSAK